MEIECFHKLENPTTDGDPMKTIVALVDFSDVTAKVLEQSRQLAKAFDARLVIVHGVPEQPMVMDLGVASPTLYTAPTAHRIEADYNALLDLRDTVDKSGLNVSVEQLDQTNIQVVLGRCKQLEADIIVVGTRHHGALFELVVGTFTGDVLKSATCPVLVVPLDAKPHAIEAK